MVLGELSKVIQNSIQEIETPHPVSLFFPFSSQFLLFHALLECLPDSFPDFSIGC
jgi:hypothetical protein